MKSDKGQVRRAISKLWQNTETRYRTLIVVCAIGLIVGSLFSDRPFIQYLGNAGGVFLGFLLGLWAQEIEKRKRKEEEIAAFEKNLKDFLPLFENRANSLRSTLYPEKIFATVIEYRLPLIEITRLDETAATLNLDEDLRRRLNKLRLLTQVIEEYLSMEINLRNELRGQIRIQAESLYTLVLEFKEKEQRRLTK